MSEAAKGNAQDDLGKLGEELAKPDKDEGRIHRLWRNVKEVAPSVASILGSVATLAKIVSGS